MPEKALEHRARQLSYLTGKAHGLLTSKRTLKLLEQRFEVPILALLDKSYCLLVQKYKY